jgi:uncharacterized RDD family membrane protein YckC
MAPVATKPVPTTPDGQRLAGWWHRVGAYLLDGIFIYLINITISIASGTQSDMTRVQEEFNRDARRNPEEVPDIGQFLSDIFDVQRDHLGAQLLAVALTLAYVALFLRYLGGTPGKLITGLRVRLREVPGRPPWSAVALRVATALGLGLSLNVVFLVTDSLAVLGLVLLLTFVWVLVDCLWPLGDDKRQALHDKVARTNVVRSR